MKDKANNRERNTAWYARCAGLAGIALLLMLWHLASLVYNPVVLPSPWATARVLVTLTIEGQAIPTALITAAHALGGFGLAALPGSMLGIAAGINVWVRRMIWPVVTIFQGIPPIAWIVLALLWFGMGGGTPVFTVAVATLPIVFVGALEGTRTVDPALLEMAHVFRIPRRMLISDIYLPHLLSYLFPVIIAGLGIAWKVALMAELLAATSGIGARLAVARINLDTAAAMAWIAVAVLLMFTFEYAVLHPLKRWLEPWRQPAPIIDMPANRMNHVVRSELVR